MAVVEIRITQSNATMAPTCVITVNDFQIYGFGGNSLTGLLLKAREIIRKLNEFDRTIPINGRTTIEEEIIGRKVWYKHCPAVVENFVGSMGLVLLRAENEEQRFPVDPWLMKHGVTVGDHRIHEDIFSPHIYWTREEE